MKLKNLYCILLSVLLFWGCSDENLFYTTPDTNETSSHHVSVETAKKRLLAFVNQMSKDGESTRSTIAGIDGKITSITTIDKNRQPLTRSNDASAAYYVFRFGDHEGFAIMGADDRIPAMLAVASGDPDSNNPDADLPDSTFWTPPQINDTTSGTWTPGPDPNAPIEPIQDYTTVCSKNLIRTKWGQRSPYNDLFYTENDNPTRNPEYRAPTACVSIAQIMTCEKFRNLVVYNTPCFDYSDTIPFEALSRIKGAAQFANNPEMSLKVAEWYRYLKGPDCLYFNFGSSGNAKLDEINNVWFVVGQLGYINGGSMHSPEYNDIVLTTLRHIHLNPINVLRNPDYKIIPAESHILSTLEYYQMPVIIGTRFRDYFLVHNAMSFNIQPDDYYYLINKGQDGVGDGYYYAKGLKFDDCYIFYPNK